MTSFALKLRDSGDRLLELITQFSQARVLVVGDLTLDEFLTGPVERVSREAPVLIIRHETTQQVPGGGANAVYNLAKLGAQVQAVGLVGADTQGQAIRSIFEQTGINTQGILSDPHRPTVTKTRISAHGRQSVTQQIVRIDRKSDHSPDLELQLQLAAHIQQQLATVDAVVCSDYGDGTLSQPVIAATLAHPRTIVDTQTDLKRYQGATIFTPNLPEAEQAVGYPLANTPGSVANPHALSQAGKDLLALTQAQQILITQGEAGMSLFGSDGVEHHIPAFNRTAVFDVTGAGDTVVAALTLALAVGASFWEAAVLGNLAASIVVRAFGTTTTNQGEMQATLLALLEELG
ncbi:MAG: PfkB family carbohydrate kinase [Leptolyngbyaceae bacterium]|nr:PfkB family carbohydrate kinase [Leptolyngbyaceae bacterium]